MIEDKIEEIGIGLKEIKEEMETRREEEKKWESETETETSRGETMMCRRESSYGSSIGTSMRTDLVQGR